MEREAGGEGGVIEMGKTATTSVRMHIRMVARCLLRGPNREAMTRAIEMVILDLSGELTERQAARTWNVPHQSLNRNLKRFRAAFTAAWQAEGLTWQDLLRELRRELGVSEAA